MIVHEGKIISAKFIQGDTKLVNDRNEQLKDDPATGIIGELGFGTQLLPFSGKDIQDEKIFGTCHVATGRSDHLGGNLTPELFNSKMNASHDDILLHPPKLLKLMLEVYLCTRMERLQKYFPIMNRPHGCLKKSHRCTPLKNFRLFLHSVIFFQLFSIQTFGYRETQKVPTVPKVSSVSLVPRYSSFSKAPKVALAPKARFAPRPPSPKFPPRVKRVTPPLAQNRQDWYLS